MRFWALVVVAFILSGFQAHSYMDAPRGEVDPQRLEGGGGGERAPNGTNQRCIDRLRLDTEMCTRHLPQKYLDACEGSIGAEDSRCAPNRCMRDRGYSRGLDTNPADYCVNSIPHRRVVAPGAQEPSRPEVQTREEPVRNTPRPTSRPDPNIERREAPQARPQPETPPPSGAAASPSNWAQESQQDIQQCSSSHSQANLCCNQPERCGSESADTQRSNLYQMAQAAQNRGDQQGLEQLCRSARRTGSISSGLNISYANTCYSKHTSCESTCKSALQKWEGRLQNCGSGCDRGLVSQTVAALDDKKQSCQTFWQLEERIRAQSYASAEDASMAALCERQSSLGTAGNEQPERSQDNNTNAMAAGGMAGAGFGSMGSSQRQQQSLQDVSPVQQALCEANPRAPGCYSPQTGIASGGGASFSDTGSTGPDDFNVGADNNFNSDDSGVAYIPEESVDPQPSQGKAIPNGGGGFVSGGQQSQQVAARSNQDSLPVMLGSGKNPNVLSGERGGSGYSPSANANSGSGFENKYGPINSKFNNRSARQRAAAGMDLKKYLPGGKSDPKRGLAGLSDFYPDIGPKHIDFFQRVSSRLKTLCKLKRLLDCQ